MRSTAQNWVGPLLVLAWALLSLFTYWGEWAVDLSALYFAAYFFGSGPADAIYMLDFEVGTGLAWSELRDSFGETGKSLAPYIYPPWVAGVLHPLAEISHPQTFFNAGYVLHIGCLAGSVLLAAKLFRTESTSLTVWCAMSVVLLAVGFPSTFTISLNQPQNLVNFLTLLAFVLAASGRSFVGGGVLGLAASIKLSPAIFLIIFISERNWRALFGFAVAGCGFVVLNLLISPPGYAAGFIETMQRISADVLLSRINHSIESTLYLVWAGLSGTPVPDFSGYIWVPGPWWLDPMMKLMLLAGLINAMWVTRQTEPPMRLWLRIQMVTIAGLLFGPLGWTHYMILPILLLPALPSYWPRSVLTSWIIVFLFAAVFSSPIFISGWMLYAPEFVPMLWGLAWILLWLFMLFWMASGAIQSGSTPDAASKT